MSQYQTQIAVQKNNLAQLKPGDKGVIVQFNENSDSSYKMKLFSLGFIKGTEIAVIKTAPLGDPVEIELRGYRISLRKTEAEIVEVAQTAEMSIAGGEKGRRETGEEKEGNCCGCNCGNSKEKNIV
ncbi:hypothetical protein AGMMS49938_15860 [Fibrobacterales bacterium]|nr:hypothetical protein AGMMS49938_15860 [Fibrobacterales bacterium]